MIFQMAEEIQPDKHLSPLKVVPFSSLLLPKICWANGYLVRQVVLIKAYRSPCKEEFLLREKSLMMVLVFTVGFSISRVMDTIQPMLMCRGSIRLIYWASLLTVDFLGSWELKAEFSRQSSQQFKDLGLELSINCVYVYSIRTKSVNVVKNHLLKHKWELISPPNEGKGNSEARMHS